MASDLLSLIFEVSPHLDHRVGEVKPWYGLAMRALFLGAVRKSYSSKTSAYLHRPNFLRAYTTSTLHFSSNDKTPGKKLRAWFRITSCDPETSRALLACVRGGGSLDMGAHLDISGLQMQVDHWWIEKEANYAELMEDSYEKIGLDGRFEMRFESPTFFKDTATKGFQDRLTPALIFSSLHAKWCAVTGAPKEPELLEYMEKELILKPISLNSQRVSTGERWRKGTKGKVMISCLDREEAHWKTICGLAMFARFAGVGKDTSIGFGQAYARRMD